MANNCNFNDPLYIHPSDTPGIYLVSDPLIGVENYGAWSRAMQIALRAKNKVALIDGSCQRPPSNSTISTYYCKLKQLWDKYYALVILPSCECDDAKIYLEHEQQQRLLQFLMGLNDSYVNVMNQVLLMNPLPMVGQACSLLSREEYHRALSSVEAPIATLYTNQKKVGNSVKDRVNLFCDHCSWSGHTKEHCYKLVGYPPWHKLYKAPNKGLNKKVYRDNGKHKRMSGYANFVEESNAVQPKFATGVPSLFTPDQYAEILKLLGNNIQHECAPVVDIAGTTSHNFSSEWIIDTGANEHMIGDVSLLQSYKSVVDSTSADLRTRRVMGICNERHELYHLALKAFSKSSPKDSFNFHSFVPRLDILYYCSATDLCKDVSIDTWHRSQSLPIFNPSSATMNPLLATEEPAMIIPLNEPAATSPTPTAIPLRRSTRTIVPLIWTHDYSSLSSVKEPQFYHETVNDAKWCAVMDEALAALERNHTWEVVDLPPQVKPIGCRWVYKIKLKSDVSVERFKTCLVAKGYTQKPGIDFHDTFSPTVKIVTIRCLLNVAVIQNWPLFQMDVTNAFLQGDLDEDIYMNLPQGYKIPGDNKVCKLNKSLYRLKHASRQWNMKFSNIMVECGYCQSQHDHSLFFKHDDASITLLVVYVDDIVITGSSVTAIQELKKFLHSKLQLKDLGILKFS
ncbi:uncharacterized protein [Primulina huaijiensis]|uniref:uncharacterized protein n=1 Tax=Primulina huaijiensis TaxID=1492673 RepID=UPI003CC77D4A